MVYVLHAIQVMIICFSVLTCFPEGPVITWSTLPPVLESFIIIIITLFVGDTNLALAIVFNLIPTFLFIKITVKTLLAISILTFIIACRIAATIPIIALIIGLYLHS